MVAVFRDERAQPSRSHFSFCNTQALRRRHAVETKLQGESFPGTADTASGAAETRIARRSRACPSECINGPGFNSKGKSGRSIRPEDRDRGEAIPVSQQADTRRHGRNSDAQGPGLIELRE